MKSHENRCTSLLTTIVLTSHNLCYKGREIAFTIATTFLPAERNLPSGGTTGEDLMNHVLAAMRKKDYCTKNKIDPLAELVASVVS